MLQTLAVLQQAGVIHIQMTSTLAARDSCSHLHDSSLTQLEKESFFYWLKSCVAYHEKTIQGMIYARVRHSAKLVVPP